MEKRKPGRPRKSPDERIAQAMIQKKKGASATIGKVLKTDLMIPVEVRVHVDHTLEKLNDVSDPFESLFYMADMLKELNKTMQEIRDLLKERSR